MSFLKCLYSCLAAERHRLWAASYRRFAMWTNYGQRRWRWSGKDDVSDLECRLVRRRFSRWRQVMRDGGTTSE